MAFGILSSVAVSQDRYTVTNLSTITSPIATGCDAINDVGHVVGTTRGPDGNTGGPFYYDGTRVSLLDATLGQGLVIAYDINDRGQIVGQASVGGSDYHAFLYESGATVDLHGTRAIGFAVNRYGQVVGRSHVGANGTRAALFTGADVVDLGALGGTSSWAYDNNARGHVTGWASVEDLTPSHAFLYKDGVMTDLGNFGGRTGSLGASINDADHVAGYAEFFDATGTKIRHAFLFCNGLKVDVDTFDNSAALEDMHRSEAAAINNTGVIVGQSWVHGPFVWMGGRAFKLRDLCDAPASAIVGLSDPKDINDRGQIIAGRYLLTPIVAEKPPKLVNLSMRAHGGSDAQTAILGFVVSGAQCRLLVRGSGPALDLFGVQGTMPNPTLTLLHNGSTLDQNDDWSSRPDADAIAEAARRLGAFPLASGSGDAAFLVDLEPGSYTAHTVGLDRIGGIALVELYDAAPEGPGRLVNASARVAVGTSDDVAVAGFVVSGDRAGNYLIRAIGPTLATHGVDGTLADPQLTLFAGGKAFMSVDDWGSAAGNPLLAGTTKQVGAFELPDGSKDAALVVTLPSGAYTVHVSGTGNTTGVALFEIYEVPPQAIINATGAR